MDKEFNEYIPNIKLVRALNRQFDSDFNTRTFSEQDFETYLCALTYACAGKELFYDAKISYKLSDEQKNNEQFMQGMLTYSLLTKINKAKEIMNSSEFQQTKKVDFSVEEKSNEEDVITETHKENNKYEVYNPNRYRYEDDEEDEVIINKNRR